MATKNEILSDDERIEAKANEKKTKAQTDDPEFVPIKIGVFEEDIRDRNERDLNLAIERRMKERQEERMMEEMRQQENRRFYKEAEEKMNRMLADLERKSKAKSASEIPLEELGMYLSEDEKPAKDFEEFLDLAYEYFSKSEGVVAEPYLDYKGHPTVGIGHLIIHKADVNDRAVVRENRKKYQELDFVDATGKPLTKEQKGAEYDKIVAARRNGTIKTKKKGSALVIISPKLSKLSEKGCKEAFRKDLKYWYDYIIRQSYDFHKYPLSVQLSLVHAGFNGRANILKSKMAGKSKNNVVSVAKACLATMEGGKNPANKAMIDGAKEGVDSLDIALNNYKQNIVISDCEIVSAGNTKRTPEANAFRSKER